MYYEYCCIYTVCPYVRDAQRSTFSAPYDRQACTLLYTDTPVDYLYSSTNLEHVQTRHTTEHKYSCIRNETRDTAAAYNSRIIVAGSITLVKLCWLPDDQTKRSTTNRNLQSTVVCGLYAYSSHNKVARTAVCNSHSKDLPGTWCIRTRGLHSPTTRCWLYIHTVHKKPLYCCARSTVQQ